MHFLPVFTQNLQKKVPFWVKTVLLGQEVHYYMIYIAYFAELNSKIWDYAQKRRICRENCNYALDERFHGHVCPRRKPAKSCHPDQCYIHLIWSFLLIHFFCSLDFFIRNVGAGAVILTCEFLVIVEIVKLRMGVFEQTVVSLFPPFSGMIVLKVIYLLLLTWNVS